MLHTLIMVGHVFIAVSIVALILLQRGKGAEMGSAFGSGASGTVFGSRGSGSFLTRTTAVLATLFFVTSLSLAFLAGQAPQPTSVIERLAPAGTDTVPNTPDLLPPDDQVQLDLPAAPVLAPQDEEVPPPAEPES